MYRGLWVFSFFFIFKFLFENFGGFLVLVVDDMSDGESDSIWFWRDVVC